MKFNKIHLILLCMLACFTACDKMTDLHIGYLEEGEIIYAAKVDSISPGPGNERIAMEVFIESQRIEFIRFYWNAYRDSMDYSINNQVGIFNIMIENLPENEYLFQTVSFDKYGNPSLPFEVSAYSYGEYYRSYLVNRRIESITQTDDLSMKVSWGGVGADVVHSTLYYINSSGLDVLEIIPASTSEIIISDFKPESEFRYMTTYRPANNSPDTFDSNETTGSFPAIVP